jgi:gamma-glutamyltranspeptidase/glutathione hydrolase
MRALALALVGLLGLTSCAQPPAQGPAPMPRPPEAASGWTPKPGWRAAQAMVAAAHPLAADAGLEMLRAGGTALDAAIAAQMVLTLVEPQSSGIGGGAFLMHWDGRAVQAWDGRETAPAAAEEGMFLGPDGQPQPARFGGRAVATPGLLRMLQTTHGLHGALPWARLFDPAIRLAEGGFAMTPRLVALLAAEQRLPLDPLARAYFYRVDGTPHPVGHVLRNPALAATLRAVAQQGAEAMHSGAPARDIAARVRTHAPPGLLSAADLVAYQPRQREPICTLWQQRWRVCGFPPPSSGHLALMQTLGVLERLPADAPALTSGVPGADWLHTYTEAARLAYADRAQFVADPAYVAAPAGDWGSLLAGGYLTQRAALVGPRSMQRAAPGRPGGAPRALAPLAEQAEHGTSHISVVDAQGRAVAMTTSIEGAFGARVMADGGTGLPGGYLLNNHMSDFSARPSDAQGRPVANRVQAGKRPRSSMSPTLVFDARDGSLVMVLGSPGGAAIIHYVAKVLVGTLQWGLDAQRAADLPNYGSFNGPAVLETGRFPAATLQALRDRGHTVVESELTSGLAVIQRMPDGWFGAADARREGVVRGY